MMSTETATAVDTGIELGDWQAGVVGGVLGAGVMAIAISVMNPPTLMGGIPGLYTLSGGVAGWIVHLSHGAVLGVVFAAIVESDAVSAESAGAHFGAGIVWGIVTWAVLAAIVMPLWLSAVGFPQAPPLPNFAIPSLVWHLLYGAVLGIVYPLTR
jgi:hypothetical protein